MSTLEVNTITPQSGTTLTLGGSGDTIQVASGVTASGFGGITEADTWRITSNFTATTSTLTVITSNWERDDTYQNGNLGTGMTQSSGIFTFPSTGFYLVTFFMNSNLSAGTAYLSSPIQFTTNNSTYNSVTEANSHIAGIASNYITQSSHKIFDITDTSNQKVRFAYNSSHAVTIQGNTNLNTTYATFIRLGDT